MRRVTPAAAVYRPDGPDPLTASAYPNDFKEMRDSERLDSTLRSARQTDIAYFWSENPYVHWNRNLLNLAVGRRLDVREAARFFALVHTTVSDAIIAGFAAKYPSARGVHGRQSLSRISTRIRRPRRIRAGSRS